MMTMEAWTPRAVSETDDYVRVSMHEKVTLYIHKYPNGDGRKTTHVYFYGPRHKQRADAYAALTGGWRWTANSTSSSVGVPQ